MLSTKSYSLSILINFLEVGNFFSRVVCNSFCKQEWELVNSSEFFGDKLLFPKLYVKQFKLIALLEEETMFQLKSKNG